MKLVVLGATGGTGREIVRRAIEQGHVVTAFVRSAGQLSEFGDRITIRQGDLLSGADLEQSIQGHDAVLSAFGPRVPLKKEDAHLLAQFAGTLTDAMSRANVKRVVVISTAFLFRDSIFPPTYLIGRLFFSSVVSDSIALEEIIATSALDWTIVRPPQLTDKPYTGKYRARLGHLPRFGFQISRADVADYFLQAVEDDAVIRKIVGISN